MIRAAVVGTGGISNAHIQGLLTFPDRCRIVALCDIVPGKAEAVRRRYGLDCPVFEKAEDMLDARIPIDLVHVCTPPFAHASVAIQAMEHGCHVLVEKPMAAGISECQAMLDTAREHHVILGQVAQNRFTDPYWRLHQILQSGIAGKICSVQVNSAWWRGHCYYDLWWRGTWEKEGGGPTLNHAVHHVDLLNWLEGGLPEKVACLMTNVCHDNSEVEDLSMAVMKYADGSLAQLTSSVVHHGEEQSIIVQCEHAKISAPWDPKAEISMDNGFPEEHHNQELLTELNRMAEAIPPLRYTGHTGEIDNLLTALEQHTEPLITGKDGIRTVELITAIYKSGFTGNMVTLPLGPDDDFYRPEGIQRHAVHFHEKTVSRESLGKSGIRIEHI